MKRLFLILLFALFSCSSDDIEQPQQEECYTILSRGVDARGNFIIVKISNYNNKRYKVDDYQDYIGVNKICYLTNLIEEQL